MINVPPDRRALVDALLRDEPLAEAPAPAGLPRAAALPPAQFAVWAAHALHRDAPVYQVPYLLRIRGALDEGRFARAFDALVAATDSLRLRAVEGPDGPRLQLADARDIRLEIVDLQPAGEREREAWILARARRLLDPAVHPLDSVLLVLGPRDHAWFLAQHHLFTDGWSVGLLLQRLSRLYTTLSAASATPPRASSFPSYRDALAQLLEDWRPDETDKSRRFFLAQLDEDVQPFGFAGLVSAKHGTGVQRESVTMVEAATRELRAAAAALSGGVAGWKPVAELLAAALAALVQRLTGRRRVSVGLACHNRWTDDRQDASPFAETTGLFADVVPLVMDLSPDDAFDRVLPRLRAVRQEAMRHARGGGIPAEARERACDVVLNCFTLSLPPLFDADTSLRRVPLGCALESLSLGVSDFASSGRLLFEFDFHDEVFPDAAVRARTREAFFRLLDAAVSQPSAAIGSVALIGDEDRRAVLHEWNGTRVPDEPPACVDALIASHARRQPSRCAVEGDEASLTYDDLQRRSDGVAAAVMAAGAAPGTVVGLSIPRSTDQVAALIGILRSGAAYLPLDPALPRRTLERLVHDGGARIVITTRPLAGCPAFAGRTVLAIDDLRPAGPSLVPDGPGLDDLAYVIFTSGSTGAPKGVEVTHRSLANYARFLGRYLDLRPADRLLQFASISFDAAAEEIFTTLASGSTLVLRNEAMLDSPDAFLDAVAERGVSVLALPTAYWHTLVDLAADHRPLPSGVRTVIIGGEAARPDALALWQRWTGGGVRLLNGYGPTETTIAATFADLTGETGDREVVTIGRPVTNTRTYVLDAAGHPLPPGFAGELYIAGMSVARGYRGDPVLTASRFSADPWHPGERRYRTGDRARWREDGQLEYLGRLDQQVKVRGHRVEPGEIEACLRRYPGVREAVVVPTDDAEGVRLHAYVAAGEAAIDSSSLRAFLETRLPAYMIPAGFACLRTLPRSITGKVDRAALPPIARGGGDEAGEPRSSTEATIAAAWQAVLHVDRVAAADHFFELGGDSLLGTRLVARLASTLGVRVPLRLLFDHPTLRALAAAVDRLPTACPASTADAGADPGEKKNG